MDIKKMNPSLLKDYMYFFDDIAFCDNPSWSLCYCTFYYQDDQEDIFPEDTAIDELRADIKGFATHKIEKHQLNGFLAYENGQPIGWCNADDQSNYKRIMTNKFIPYDARKKVGAIVCYVVDPNHRGKGVASALLKAACEAFKDDHYDYVEAYPVKNPANSAENYHGPLQMYLNNDFEIIEELETFYIVRKTMTR